VKKVAIIGGGISGLSALHFLRTRYADKCEVRLFEKENRLGGTIGTDREDGYISDWGSNGFLDKVPLTLDLVEEIGLTKKLETAAPTSENRFIYRHGQLNAISASPIKFMKSPILSLGGRLRIVTEPFRKAKRDDSDETVHSFASRRIGREAADSLVGPMVSGIFGGDAKELSLPACFPVMREMESQHGSLVKALIAKKRAGKSGGPAGPSGRLTSFEGGLYTIIERFEELYGDHIRVGAEVAKIAKSSDKYTLKFETAESETFDAVIVASPTHVASELVSHLEESLSELLASIPYASISVVCLGYKAEYIDRDLTGFGFLIPRSEGLRILGSIWTSSIFRDRSPDGMVQLRTMIGGATDPQAVSLSDSELLEIVHRELSAILGIKNNPGYVNIFKWKRGIPQYVLGHLDKMKKLQSFGSLFPGLFFTGNSYHGVGLNDCILRSESVVKALYESTLS